MNYGRSVSQSNPPPPKRILLQTFQSEFKFSLIFLSSTQKNDGLLQTT